MAVKFKNKKSGEVIEGLLVTGDQNDLVGIVVWAASRGVEFNQVTKRNAGGEMEFLPVYHGASLEEALPVGTLIEISAEGASNSWSPEHLAEHFEEVHDG